MEVARDIADERRQRVELRRVGQAGRVALLRRDEPGGRRRLIDRRTDDLRAVDAEQVRGTDAVHVHVAEAPSAADHGLRHRRVREAETRAEVVAIGIDERAIGNRSVLRRDHRLGDRIEVGQVVVRLPHRRRVLVAHAGVHRQLVVDADVVLHVREVQVLLHMRDEERAERVLRAEAEHEVGEVVQIARGGARWPGELSRVAVQAVQRVHVLHFDVDVLKLVARFERLASHQP